MSSEQTITVGNTILTRGDTFTTIIVRPKNQPGHEYSVQFSTESTETEENAVRTLLENIPDSAEINIKMCLLKLRCNIQ